MATAPSVPILGIGNLLWADEGFGVRALETLQRHYEFPSNVRLLDGGTQGIYLVQHIREAEILVVFDAVDYGLPGGTLKRVEGGRSAQILRRQEGQSASDRFPFDGWPSLVLLSEGRYVGAISRMQDWDVYLSEMERLLNSEPSSMTGFKIPVVSASSTPTYH